MSWNALKAVVPGALYSSERIPSAPGVLLQFVSFVAVLTSSTLGSRSRSSSSCNASWSTVDGRFRSWLKRSSHFALIPSLSLMMAEPLANVGGRGGVGGGGERSIFGRAIDGLGSAVQHLGVVGVGVELHFFSFLLPPSVLHAAKLSLGSALTVSVSVAP